MIHYGRGKGAYPPRFYRHTLAVQQRALHLAWCRLLRVAGVYRLLDWMEAQLARWLP